MSRQNDIHAMALGRWKSILPAIGVPAQFLNGKSGPCPFCGGKDRYRFDDQGGKGSFICNQCGAGGGVDFVMRFKSCDFITAKKLIEPLIGSAPLVVPKAARSESDMKSRMEDAWKWARPLYDGDASTRYLRSRGIDLKDWPTQLRNAEDSPYFHDDKSKTYHPAMIAKFVSPDARDFIIQRLFLTPDGFKADVPEPRKTAPGKTPPGGAVRLGPSAETMGVGEGVETCLSAMLRFGVPVWSCLTAGNLQKFQPPPTAKHIIIFGDNDAKFAGQAAAYGLAFKLSREGFSVEVRIPDEVGTDWNDFLMGDLGLKITKPQHASNAPRPLDQHPNDRMQAHADYLQSEDDFQGLTY